MKFRFLIIALFASALTSAQVQKVGFKDNYTLLHYTVKGIDTVKIPGNWERDKRDLATAVYLVENEGQIGFYIDTKNKRYAAAASEAEALKLYLADKTNKLKRSGWEFELLQTDNESYQLYKIKSLRHPDGNQIGLYGVRGKYVYNIVSYGETDDTIKSEFLIRLFKNTKP